MKKAILLALLLVVAASAAITFPNGAPSKVGEQVDVLIPGDGLANLYVMSGGNQYWVYPIQVDLPYSGKIEITHPGNGLKLLAKGAEDDSTLIPFDVVIGDAYRWHIIAPGETADRGEADNVEGKTGTASVTAAVDGTYEIQVCDKWSNIVSSSLTPIVSCTDTFADLGTPVIGSNTFKLRAAGSQTITVTGGGLTEDFASVIVNPGDATYLLLICEGETALPGDNATTGSPGKYGDPVDATLGSPYLVEIVAVDEAWNKVTSYNDPDVNVYAGSENFTKDVTYTLENGTTGNVVDVVFNDVKLSGEYIDAVGSVGLQSDYSTLVVVLPGVDSLLASLNPSTVPVGVHADLEARAWVAGDPLPFGYAFAKLIDGPATYFHFLNDTIQIQDGFGSTEVWADTTGTYTIEVTAGVKADTVVLTVEERPGVTVIPNPYKYGAEGVTDIKFSYKVAEAGAAEIVLLIADIYGNVVYKATYGSSEPEALPGTQEIAWDGTNSNGTRIASGMYQAVMKITLTDLSSQVVKKNFMVIW